MPHSIFYSWQSDLPNPCNRGFIQECLEGAIEDLKTDEELKVDMVLDRDTSGVAGSPDIGQTIFSKIDQATAFVCDVSIISDGSAKRPTPNPNVLIELGYALKKLSQSKVIMVMNSAFGKPELLPFDLKQKRVVVYEMPENGNKADVRKSLRKNLSIAIKTILLEHDKLNEVPAPIEKTPTEEAIEALKSNLPNQDRAIHAFMKWLSSELKKLDPHTLPGEPYEILVESINKTIPLVKEFDKVADTISAMKASEAAKTLVKDFEHLLGLYYLPEGFSGSYNRTDFDFFKFVGHELFTILFGYLVRDQRWQIIKSLLKLNIYVSNGPHDHKTQSFIFISSHIALLDEVRNNRLIVNNQKKLSIHADLLKERHENGPLAENLSWSEFKDADLFLFLYSFANPEKGQTWYWWPRTSVYFGWNSPIPRYLVETTTFEGAKAVSEALNLPKVESLPKALGEAKEYLAHGMRQSNIFADPLNGFDTKTIAVS